VGALLLLRSETDPKVVSLRILVYVCRFAPRCGVYRLSRVILYFAIVFFFDENCFKLSVTPLLVFQELTPSGVEFDRTFFFLRHSPY